MMKTITKMKIVERVCKIINLPSPYRRPPYMIEKELPVITLRVQQSYPNPDLLNAPIGPTQIEKELCMMIGNSLIGTNLIEFTNETNPFDPLRSTNFRAKILIVQPTPKQK